jgi:hypothetical protein
MFSWANLGRYNPKAFHESSCGCSLEAKGALLYFTDESLASARKHTGSIIPGIPMETFLAYLTVVPFGEMLAVALARCGIARSSMPVALTRLASGFLCITKASLLAVLAPLPPREVLALITAAHSLSAPTVPMAATVFTTVGPRPAEVTDAHVVWGSRALPILALDAAGFVALLPSVPLKARITLAIIRARQVYTRGIDMALVKAEAALVDVRTGEVLPFLTLALTL